MSDMGHQKSSDASESLNGRGYPAVKCDCGRYTFALPSGAADYCCTPCVNGQKKGKQYPHQELCERNEDLQVFYPRSEVRPGFACPVCGSSAMEKGQRSLFSERAWRCRNVHCSGMRAIDAAE